MINLLPPGLKSNYRYARRNVVLRRWLLLFMVALVGLGGLATYGQLTLQQSIDSYSKQVSAVQQRLQQENVSRTQQQVTSTSSSLKLAVKVLGQEVLFSKLIQQIGAVMPPNAVLSGLTINQVSGGLDLSANASNYNTATQVQVNLADPKSGIFSRVDIQSINCSITTANGFPCTVSLRALFNSDNQFLFINQGKKS